jgi:tetratricopeptide (TPR) repeat protein
MSKLSSKEWLQEISVIASNPGLRASLNEHENSILSSIAHDLYSSPSDIRSAFSLLLTVVDEYILASSHPEEWEMVLIDALLQAQDLRDLQIMVNIYIKLGELYRVLRRYDRSLTALEIALEKATSADMSSQVIHITEQIELVKAVIEANHLKNTEKSTIPVFPKDEEVERLLRFDEVYTTLYAYAQAQDAPADYLGLRDLTQIEAHLQRALLKVPAEYAPELKHAVGSIRHLVENDQLQPALLAIQDRLTRIGEALQDKEPPERIRRIINSRD